MPSPSSGLCPPSQFGHSLSCSSVVLFRCLTGSCFRGTPLVRLPLLTLPCYFPPLSTSDHPVMYLCPPLSPGMRTGLHLEKRQYSQQSQLRRVFSVLHSSRDCCEVRQRRGQTLASRPCQSCYRSEGGLPPPWLCLEQRRGWGSVLWDEVGGAGHDTTEVTLALWGGVWRILKICFVESSFLLRGALRAAFGSRRPLCFLQDSVPRGPIIMDQQLRAESAAAPNPPQVVGPCLSPSICRNWPHHAQACLPRLLLNTIVTFPLSILTDFSSNPRGFSIPRWSWRGATQAWGGSATLPAGALAM